MKINYLAILSILTVLTGCQSGDTSRRDDYSSLNFVPAQPLANAMEAVAPSDMKQSYQSDRGSAEAAEYRARAEKMKFREKLDKSQKDASK